MEDTGRSGFTLLELLVTLALVGLLWGLAVPAMDHLLAAARLRSATEILYRDLQQARTHALTHRRRVYFSVITAAGRWCYGWSDEAACDCRSDDGEVTACRAGGQARQRFQRRRSMDFPSVELHLRGRDSARTLTFSPLRGTASADSLALRNHSGERRVIVSPLGRVRICSPIGGRKPSC